MYKTANILFWLCIFVVQIDGLTENEEKVVNDVLTILKRGTSVYPLEDLMHQLARTLGFKNSANSSNQFQTNYETIYDMLLFVDTNGKHTADQHAKLRQIIDIVDAKMINTQSTKRANLRTLVVEKNEDTELETTSLSLVKPVLKSLV